MTQSLTTEIAMRDVESCWPLEPEDAPDDAKGLGVLLGWVAVHLSLHNLRQVVRAVVDWASRNSREGYNRNLWIEVGMRSVAYPPV